MALGSVPFIFITSLVLGPSVVILGVPLIPCNPFRAIVFPGVRRLLPPNFRFHCLVDLLDVFVFPLLIGLLDLELRLNLFFLRR